MRFAKVVPTTVLVIAAGSRQVPGELVFHADFSKYEKGSRPPEPDPSIPLHVQISSLCWGDESVHVVDKAKKPASLAETTHKRLRLEDDSGRTTWTKDLAIDAERNACDGVDSHL